MLCHPAPLGGSRAVPMLLDDHRTLYMPLAVLCVPTAAITPPPPPAGDHLQLPPTILSPAAAAGGLGTTLFERLQGLWPTASTMLTVQYRMHHQIMDWSSQELYQVGRTVKHGQTAGGRWMSQAEVCSCCRLDSFLHSLRASKRRCIDAALPCHVLWLPAACCSWCSIGPFRICWCMQGALEAHDSVAHHTLSGLPSQPTSGNTTTTTSSGGSSKPGLVLSPEAAAEALAPVLLLVDTAGCGAAFEERQEEEGDSRWVQERWGRVCRVFSKGGAGQW
jgi:hypothetical protein